MTNDEITTEDLLNMRVVPEQQADLAAVMNAFGLAPSLEGLTAEEQIANLTRQRDAWRHDALTAEQRIDALNERLADRDAQLDQAKTARARDLVRYSQDEMFLRLNAAETQRDVALDLVEGLRAELAETTRFKDVLHGIVRTVARIVHRSPNDDGGYLYADVPAMVERELAEARRQLAEADDAHVSYAPGYLKGPEGDEYVRLLSPYMGETIRTLDEAKAWVAEEEHDKYMSIIYFEIRPVVAALGVQQ